MLSASTAPRSPPPLRSIMFQENEIRQLRSLPGFAFTLGVGYAALRWATTSMAIPDTNSHAVARH
ncbi:MAG: hypothetical protein CTY17_03730 [Methylomonas sp.]|nr:MAG: hypothetical protein CTY17_03730 [Methylomonas sp.]PPD51993.1 MAG: hypothetical protein CTY11_10265 [Methylomonas sp.]